METQKKSIVEKLRGRYYQAFLIIGAALAAASAGIYEFVYSAEGDAVFGLTGAILLFFGIMLIGNGIRGWRESEEIKVRYINMKSKEGAEIKIKKKNKRYF